MNPVIGIGILTIVVIVIVALYFAFRPVGTGSVPASPASPAPVATGDINNVVDTQIEEIANDVANSAREGYISRKEYMSPESDPESAQSLEDFTRIVLSNVMGKPVKAVVSRDDVSGVLKVVMTGVDPTVFEPSVSSISDCVSEKIKTSTTGPRDVPSHARACADEYFSVNGTEFEDNIVPTALTMYENAFNEYASGGRKEEAKQKGGPKKIMACKISNSGAASFNACLEGSEIPKITWQNIIDKMKPPKPAPKPEPVPEPAMQGVP